MASGSRAPSQERTHHVFHIYVDPIYGDDALAVTQNPSALSQSTQIPFTGRPLDFHWQGAAWVPGVLNHAPYSFRTVGQAIQYIRQTAFPGSASKDTGLPWTNPGTNLTVDYVLIHCLPGIYGHSLGPSDREPKSGLPYNGETFPLYVPDRVSIQGTSALDTVFDGRGSTVSIFSFTPAPGPIPAIPVSEKDSAWRYSFIDSVSIHGARAGGFDWHGFPSGCGVFISSYTGNLVGPGRETQTLGPIVSNCMIYDNDIGIALVDPFPYPSPPTAAFVTAKPHIVGNTLAWNQIGLWNGSLQSPLPPYYQVTGWAMPTVTNNIIDTTPPAGWSGVSGPYSVCEGMDPADMLAAMVNLVPLGAGLNFNAYDPARVNGNIVPPPGWFWTLSRSGAGIPTPVVNLGGVIGYSGANRGELFICDVLRANGQSLSEHDLRLAPQARLAGAGAYVGNPCLNRGASGSVTMVNTLAVASGLPLSAADIATFDAWDWDAEGFGNRRIVPRTGVGITLNTNSAFTEIDLGADEVAWLVMGGYAPHTRIFSRSIAGVHDGPAGDFTRIYFFNLPGAYARPKFNVWFADDVTGSVSFAWYAQARTNPNPSTLGAPTFPWVSAGFNNYTDGGYSDYSGLLGWRWDILHGPSPNYYLPSTGRFNFPFMRNLACDFSPHLLIDWHPWWSMLFRTLPIMRPSGQLPSGEDPYASNPWYRGEYGYWAGLADNPRLFYVAGVSDILVGLTNSPGTWISGATVSWPHRWLHPWQATATFLGAPPGATYVANVQGFHQSDVAPSVIGRAGNLFNGLRINCEVEWYQGQIEEQNLQTFLTINADVTPAQARQSGSNRSMFPAQGDKAGLQVKANPAEAMRLRSQLPQVLK